MSQPSDSDGIRSSSQLRPLGPEHEKGVLEIDGAIGGPIRLPTDEANEFIESFNETYKRVQLKIEQPTKSE